MVSPNVLNLPSELLVLWHTHRLEILLSAGVVLACIRLALHWRQWRSKERDGSFTPPLVFPTEKKESQISVPAALPPAVQPRPTGPRRVTGVKKVKAKSRVDVARSLGLPDIQPHIFYYSLGGSTKVYAKSLQHQLSSTNLVSAPESTRPAKPPATLLPPLLHDLETLDYDDFFTSPPTSTPSNSLRITQHFYLILLPTYNIPTPLTNLLTHLKETHHDFRVDTAPLAILSGYSVFGFGDRSEWPTEEEGFCSQALEVDRWMARLTAGKRAFPLGVADVGSRVKGEVEGRFGEWSEGIREVLGELAKGRGLGEGVEGTGEAVESGDEGSDEEDEEVGEVDGDGLPSATRPQTAKTTSRALDLEDIQPPTPIDFTTSTTSPILNPAKPKQMVPPTSQTYTTLTKQGYTIVGTHSGVKTCRWTKSALRGRGSCYKYSFYGIASHLCMEATPSLSCSSKCVFCWRHGTNPVSTVWKWEVDAPDLVFAGMKEGHYRKIKMLKGVPGVRAERFQEAMKIRHCALSLVGEPIFYPHINALLALLHKERISTFLVCNAQHPDELERLDKVTQLYVSIDAATESSLKKIDRPLHRDFWPRFLRCMDIIRSKRFTQRTVFRLTLVKDFNISLQEIEAYADLVARALPGFVEVKGVTFCGTSSSKGAGLSMANVPFWREVEEFVALLEAALGRRGLGYGVAAEHGHSCCVLLADRSRFFVPRKGDSDGVGEGEGKWHTLIDFQGFFDCLETRGQDFGPEDYLGAETPEWALRGKGGFDPRDERVDRKGRPIEVVE